NSADRANAVDRLVLRSLTSAIELAVPGHLCHTTTMDHAAVAAPVARHEVPFDHRSVHRRGATENTHLEVVGRQHAHHVHVGHRASRAEHGETASGGAFHQFIAPFEHGLREGGRIGNLQPFRAAHGHSL